MTGTLTFDASLADHLLASLPPMLVLPASAGERRQWHEISHQLLALEVTDPRPGGAAMVSRILDLLFIQVLRAWAAATPDRTGWLVAVMDPGIGRAPGRTAISPTASRGSVTSPRRMTSCASGWIWPLVRVSRSWSGLPKQPGSALIGPPVNGMASTNARTGLSGHTLACTRSSANSNWSKGGTPSPRETGEKPEDTCRKLGSATPATPSRRSLSPPLVRWYACCCPATRSTRPAATPAVPWNCCGPSRFGRGRVKSSRTPSMPTFAPATSRTPSKARASVGRLKMAFAKKKKLPLNQQGRKPHETSKSKSSRDKHQGAANHGGRRKIPLHPNKRRNPPKMAFGWR